MIRLRPFKPDDSKIICNWFDNEKTFDFWSGGQYTYPLTAEQFITHYAEYEQDERAWMMTALDESGEVCGHFIFRLADYEKNSIHIGHIVVSPEKRGQGLGKAMVKAALKYAVELMGMKRITLGVYEGNIPAQRCYESLGFKEFSKESDHNLINMAFEK
ncbi:MAG: GNAT family N-acetyltransferase [Oscillospiraceae bacterium]